MVTVSLRWLPALRSEAICSIWPAGDGRGCAAAIGRVAHMRHCRIVGAGSPSMGNGLHQPPAYLAYVMWRDLSLDQAQQPRRGWT